MVPNKSDRRPLMDPVLLMLKSRRALTAITAVLVGLLMVFVPDLEPVRGELLTLITTVALVLIGGYSLEDAVNAARQRPNWSNNSELRELVKGALDDLFRTVDKEESDV